MTNLDSILKSRDITLPTKVRLVKAMVFPDAWMWELDYNESWVLKNWCFELWCWRRLLRVPWTARRSNQSILKEISPKCSLEGLMLPTKVHLVKAMVFPVVMYGCESWSWNPNALATWSEELTHFKRPWCWERLMEGREGVNRGWDGWMASLTEWTSVWVNTGR